MRVFVPDDEEPLAATILAVIATRVGTAGIVSINNICRTLVSA